MLKGEYGEKLLSDGCAGFLFAESLCAAPVKCVTHSFKCSNDTRLVGLHHGASSYLLLGPRL